MALLLKTPREILPHSAALKRLHLTRNRLTPLRASRPGPQVSSPFARNTLEGVFSALLDPNNHAKNPPFFCFQTDPLITVLLTYSHRRFSFHDSFHDFQPCYNTPATKGLCGNGPRTSSPHPSLLFATLPRRSPANASTPPLLLSAKSL